MIIVPRDEALDTELESGAHLTLIIVAIVLAFLCIATAVVFYLFPVCRRMRNTQQVFQPKMSSTPSAFQRHVKLPSRNSTLPPQKCYPLFASVLPDAPSLPTRNKSTGFFHQRDSLPIPKSHVARPLHFRATLSAPTPTATARSIPQPISRLEKIAEEVVGRHPHSQPLAERTPTLEEIGFISGHVHFPWACDTRLQSHSQPFPVKVSKVKPEEQNRFDLSAGAGHRYPLSDENNRREHFAIPAFQAPRKRTLIKANSATSS